MGDPSALSVEQVAALPPEELDRLLGEAILAESFLSKPPTAAEARAAGASHFAALLPALRRDLCANATLRALLGPGAKERNTLIAAIADLLVHASPLPVVLAARILHFGYDRLCPSEAP